MSIIKDIIKDMMPHVEAFCLYIFSLQFSREGSILATVNNIFQHTDVTDSDVKDAIEKAIENSPLFSNVTYEGKYCTV